MPKRLDVTTHGRNQMVEITSQVAEEARRAGWLEGSVLVFVPHTTAGVTINENADPTVVADMLMFFNGLVPQRADFTHGEGNSDAHIKACLMGSSVRVMVEGGRLCLGRWQGIYFCEFDGPRRREVWLSFDASPS